MQIFHNAHHAQHAGRQEMYRGRLVACHEVPQRLQHVLDELARRPVGHVTQPPAELPLDAVIYFLVLSILFLIQCSNRRCIQGFCGLRALSAAE